jgi:polar amino acid transport system permease protein
VDVGQLEAARALGLPYSTTMLKVVIPQSIKNILPTLGSEFIVLVKDTSIVSFIAVVDLTKAFRQIGDATYEYVIPYLMLALI